MKEYEYIDEQRKISLSVWQANKDHKHENVKKKKAWKAIGEKLEIKGKATEVIW